MREVMEVLLSLLLVVSVGSAQGLSENCRTNCGNLNIEYPFGTSPDCYHDESFLITCNLTKTGYKPYLRKGNIQVVGISRDGELRIMLGRAKECFDSGGHRTNNRSNGAYLSNFTLSYTKNKFIAVGCDTYAYLLGRKDDKYTTGCMSACSEFTDSSDGACSGVGCCQIPIPREVNDFTLRAYSFDNHSSVQGFNPCSYAFLAEDGSFNFSAKQDLKDLRNVTEFPVVVDWSIGNKSCEEAGNDSVCGENSTCVNSTTQRGYTCKCKDGFHGNPYLRYGCTDIDECKTNSSICAKPEYCHNTIGGFVCRCPKGHEGDAAKQICKPKRKEWAIILLGTTICFLVFLLGLCCISQEMRNRKRLKLREKFFEQNGGIMLRQRISGKRSSSSTSSDDIKIFSEEEIKKATGDYEESKILGEGGQGTVYKGTLSDEREIAIKRARIGDHSQVEQFINEVIVLSQINHRNVVKLLGCCLETEVPLLVYEFVSNGNLFDHLHTSKFSSFLPWEDRLRIAAEIAGTLSYLHSSASVPIIHRDVKSANILLDDKFTAKVSDFGSSRLIPADREQVTTLVQGTLGYLDPEYFHTSTLSEKSDVYSFGVVLMELLSGQTALNFDRPQNTKHLVTYFACALKENRIDEVLDSEVVRSKNREQLQETALLAVRCTRVNGEDRPTMREVASELEGLRIMAKHKWIEQEPEEELGHLLEDQMLHVQGDSSNSGYASVYDSIQSVAKFDIEAGR